MRSSLSNRSLHFDVGNTCKNSSRGCKHASSVHEYQPQAKQQSAVDLMILSKTKHHTTHLRYADCGGGALATTAPAAPVDKQPASGWGST